MNPESKSNPKKETNSNYSETQIKAINKNLQRKAQKSQFSVSTIFSETKQKNIRQTNALAKRRGHLVGESTGHDHTIGLPRTGPENDTESVKIVASSASMHHLHRAAGETKGHGPDGSTAGPV